jgi:hypothetical protein
LSLSYAPQPDGTFIKQEYQLGFLPVFSLPGEFLKTGRLSALFMEN